MANDNTIATAYVQLVASADGVSDQVRSALGEAGTSSGNSFASAFKKTAGVAGLAVTAATAAATAFGKKSLEAGSDFDAAMSQVAATMGLTNDELNNISASSDGFTGTLREFAQYLGSTTAFTATQAAEALNYMALAGYDADTSMQMLPLVLDLAASGSMDLAAASDMVTDAQSALGLSLDETRVMVDQMAKTASTTNTSVAQLGEGFLTIGANAKQLSGGTDELAQLLGVLADNGIKASEGGTHLRNILLAMNPQTEDAVKAWDALGTSAYDADGNLRPLVDVFADINAGMDGMSTQERTQMLSDMFNKTDLASINALLDTTSERFTAVGDAIANANGSAAAMAQTQLDNLKGDTTLMQSALEGLEIAISDGLTPTIRDFTAFAGESLQTITTAYLEGGITGAMDALGTIISDGMNMLIDKVPDIVEAGGALLVALTSGIGDNLPKIAGAAITIISTLGEELIPMLPKLAEQIVIALPDVITQIANELPKFVPILIEAGVEMMINLVAHLPEIILSLINAIPAIFKEIAKECLKLDPILEDAAQDALDAFRRGFIDLKNSPFGQAVKKIFNSIKEEFSKLWTDFKGIGSNIIDGIIGGLTSGIDSAVGSIKNVGSKIKDGFCDFFGIHSPSKLFEQYGQFIDMGLVNGIDGGANLVNNAMDDLASGMTRDYTASVKTAVIGNSPVMSANVNATSNNGIRQMIHDELSNMALNLTLHLDPETKRWFKAISAEAKTQSMATGRAYAF